MSVRAIVKSIQDIMRQDTGVDGDAQRISQLCWMFFLKIIDDQDQELELLSSSYRSPIPKRFQWREWAADPEGITGEELLAFVNGDLFPALKNLPTSTMPGDRRRVVKDVFEDAYNYMKSGQLIRQVVNKIAGVDFNNLVERQHFGDIYEQILTDLQSAGNAGEYYTPRAVTAFMVDRIDPVPGEVLFDPSCGTGGFLTCSIRHMRDRYVKTPTQEQALQAGLRAVEKKQLPHMLCVTNMLLHGIEDPSFVRHDNTLARPYISYSESDRVDVVLTNPPFGGREEDGIESNFPTHFRTKETADLFLALIVRLLKKDGRAAVVLPDGTLFGEGVKTRLKEHLMEECNLHTIVRLPNSVFKPYASIGTNLLFFEKGEPTKDIWFYEHRVPDGQKAYSMTKPIRVEHFQGCIDWWGGKTRNGRVETPQAWKMTVKEIKDRGYNLDIKNPHTVASERGDPEVLLVRLNAAEAQTASLRNQLKAILAEALAMNAGRLLAHYEQIEDAPNAIGRLRRFILDLAVRGKLVPQDPVDEPASELLKRIAKEKASARKRQQDASEIDHAGDLGLIPKNWCPVPLLALGSWAVGSGFPKNEQGLDEGPHFFLKVSDMNLPGNEKYITTANNFIDDDAAGRMRAKIHPAGTIIFPKIGGAIATNKRRILTRGSAIDNNCLGISFSSYVDTEWAYLLLTTLDFTQYQAGTAVPALQQGVLEQIAVGLPPIAEQHRIVSKVDELMALCDRLEASLTDTAASRRRLLDTLLAEALEPS